MQLQLLSIAALASTAGLASGMQSVSSSEPLDRQLPCADSVRDQNGGPCLKASRVPGHGILFPLSRNFFVDPATGWVGVGTDTPEARLGIEGDVSLDGDLKLSGPADGIEFSSFNPLFEPSAPMLTMFDAGISNPDRMVFGHSPLFPNFGLRYSDATDEFVFQSSASNEVLAVDLNANRVVIDGYLLAQNENQASAITAFNNSLTPTTHGIYAWGRTGITGEASLGGFGVFSNNHLGAIGTKSFVQPHPSDPAKEIRYVALEGNEAGTYFRGTSRLEGGVCVLEVPEDFRMVTEANGLTVQVTALGASRVWVEERGLERIVVCGDRDVEFDYFVNGLRLGFSDRTPVVDNEMFIPRYRNEPYLPQLPEAVRQLMVESGLLNPDYTPNEATAARLGWTLTDRLEGEGRRAR